MVSLDALCIYVARELEKGFFKIKKTCLLPAKCQTCNLYSLFLSWIYNVSAGVTYPQLSHTTTYSLLHILNVITLGSKWGQLLNSQIGLASWEDEPCRTSSTAALSNSSLSSKGDSRLQTAGWHQSPKPQGLILPKSKASP